MVAIADYDFLGGRLAEAVAAATRGGVRWFLLRLKALPTGERAALAANLHVGHPEVFFSMHGDLEAARHSGCAGVHHPAASIALCAQAGGLLAGCSCHDASEMGRAVNAGAGYCFLSPVFKPTSKNSLLPPLGAKGFRALSAADIPVYALGGSTPERLPELAEAGAYGVAVLGDLFGADCIEERAARWTTALERTYGKR